jgi:two-component system sensor histidine kinase KdpD
MGSCHRRGYFVRSSNYGVSKNSLYDGQMNFIFPFRHAMISFLLLGLITIVSQLFTSQLGLLNIALIHLVPVIVIALHGNIRSTMIITTISVVVFDLLYVPPLYSFDVHDLSYIWSFIIFFTVGYTISYQAKRIQANAVKEIFLNTLSHDLKTPLSSILGNASLLLKEQTQDPLIRRDILIQINDSTQRMNRLIANLLDSARMQDIKSPLRMEWCDLEDIVGVALQEFRYNPKQSQIEVAIDPQLKLFWGDCALLVRLVVNLIDNALKYTENGKKISLTITSDGSIIKILCFNESDPIKKADLKNMFDRFYRIDHSADIGGSGVGLSICRDIVHAHKGIIEAYNVLNGVCFEIRFSVSKSPSDRLNELP